MDGLQVGGESSVQAVPEGEKLSDGLILERSVTFITPPGVIRSQVILGSDKMGKISNR